MMLCTNPRVGQAPFGDGVRMVALNPFDLVYTYFPERDLVHVEALIHQCVAW